MRRILAELTVVAVACISTPASAMNSWDWANIIRALTPILAPPVVVVPAPTVIVIPAPVAPAAMGVAALPAVGATVSDQGDCEEKAYIQYKDELKVFGHEAIVAQMCQISAGTTLACDRELTKITLVLRAADINVDVSSSDCLTSHLGASGSVAAGSVSMPATAATATVDPAPASAVPSIKGPKNPPIGTLKNKARLTSKYMVNAEKFAKGAGCDSPVATMNIASVTWETFTTTCTKAEPMAIRCDDGNCRTLR
jgi:hypothetical protein